MSQAAALEVQRQVLSGAARLLGSAADFSDTLRQTIGACLPALGDFGFFDVVHAGGVRRTVAAHDAADIEGLLAPTQWVKQERQDLNLCALSTGQPALHPHTDESWYRSIADNDGHFSLLQTLAFGSMITVPVRYRDELVGALTLFMGRSGRRHTQADLEFASEIALLAAPVVVNARLLERHKEAEAALRTSEERLRMAVEAGQVGIWDWDIARSQISWSHRVYEMFEMQPGSDNGGFEGVRSRVHPEDWPKVETGIAAALAGGPPYSAEFRTVLRDGRMRWLTTKGHLVRDSDGRPLRMVGATTDITERMELLGAERRARDLAETARRRLELLARAGAEHARSLDPQDTLKAIATTLVPSIADWCRIDVMDEEGVLQRAIAYHVDPERAQRALEMSRTMRAAPGTVSGMAWVLANGKPHHGNYESPEALADPQLREYTQTFGMREHFILPLLARGRVIGVMAVIQAESGRELDAEDRALTEEFAVRAALALDNARLYAEAEAARRQAERANQAKDEFLAMLGHELRNPLAPISTALELMARRAPGASLEERGIIGRQVAHMSRLIDDLLDVSRITQGKIQLRREAVDMKVVVANAVELTRPVFEKHERAVELQLAREEALVEGDAVRLTQVLCNLLVNAAKFTPHEGLVRLTLEAADGRVAVSVEDTGAGIAAELLPRVFDLFVQGQQPIDRQAGGLGLGLAIVRNLVEMHRGSVTAESEETWWRCTVAVSRPKARGRDAARDSVCSCPRAFRLPSRRRRPRRFQFQRPARVGAF
jgi:PAS domain S-box-containing protein